MVMLAALACGGRSPHDATPTAKPRPAIDLDAVGREVDLLLGTHGAPLARRGDAETSLRQFVRDRLEQDELYDELAPKLLSFLVNMRGGSYQVAPYTLKPGRTPKGQAYFYLDDACEPDELERVAPWWDPRASILVCAKDVKPALVRDPNSGAYCEASENQAAERTCGCGPHLVNCAKDAEQAVRLRQATRQEIIRTLEWTIRSRRPLGEILTGSETVRSGLGSWFYQRSEFFRTGVLPRVDLNAALARSPRPDGFDGGIISAPYLLYFDPARRPIMAALWHDLLCVPFQSTHVTADDILTVGLNFRQSARPVLAEKAGCKSCHVRLEYGMQALEQFPNGHNGQRLDATVSKTGKKATRFYVRDENDLRAEGPATPAWLADMFRRQPEFATCMADKTLAYIYGGYAISPAVREPLVEKFRRGQDLASLIEDAVVARFLGGR